MSRTAAIILITIAAAALAVPFFSLIERFAGRFNGVRARRSVAALQLIKWGVVVAAGLVVVAEALGAAGIPPTTMTVLGTAFATGLAFALRDPLADFIAAATMLAERTMLIGDEVVVNEEIRGKATGLGLRSLSIVTWDGDTVFITASGIKTLRNLSASASRAVVDIDIPAHIRVARAQAVIEAACATAVDESFESDPKVIGVVSQFLGHYVIRVSCFVSPARHRSAEYRLKAAAVDAVIQLVEDAGDDRSTEELVGLVALVGGMPPPNQKLPPPLISNLVRT